MVKVQLQPPCLTVVLVASGKRSTNSGSMPGPGDAHFAPQLDVLVSEKPETNVMRHERGHVHVEVNPMHPHTTTGPAGVTVEDHLGVECPCTVGNPAEVELELLLVAPRLAFASKYRL